MSRFGWDLPPGVTNSMLPGNSAAERRAEAEAEAVADALATAGVGDDILDTVTDAMLTIIEAARNEAVAECAADEKMAREMSETIYCRKVDPDTDNECWVICAKGDPGAVRFTAEHTT